MERQRIIEAGGEVNQDEFGCYRVNRLVNNMYRYSSMDMVFLFYIFTFCFSYYILRRLNMSRSIGDLDLKPYGVTAQPTVTRRSLKHHKVRDMTNKITISVLDIISICCNNHN